MYFLNAFSTNEPRESKGSLVRRFLLRSDLIQSFCILFSKMILTTGSHGFYVRQRKGGRLFVISVSERLNFLFRYLFFQIGYWHETYRTRFLKSVRSPNWQVKVPNFFLRLLNALTVNIPWIREWADPLHVAYLHYISSYVFELENRPPPSQLIMVFLGVW